jgi:hypothetical protein
VVFGGGLEGPDLAHQREHGPHLLHLRLHQLLAGPVICRRRFAAAAAAAAVMIGSCCVRDKCSAIGDVLASLRALCRGLQGRRHGHDRERCVQALPDARTCARVDGGKVGPSSGHGTDGSVLCAQQLAIACR